MYPQVFGKYVLERELARGGMARVVLATLRGAGGFEKKLVVKQIRDELAFDQQFVRRFVEEAKTTVALSHPNIVPVYELGVEQGTYFLAMELVEGLSVAELLRERNADGERRVLTPEEGAYVGVEVCRALDYAHRRMKVVHRDITPRNVMIDEEGQVKLIDFGIATPALVSGHEILGSPGHMAPEQVDGGELGPPTDIFAVAVLLMEAWTGAPPFRRPTPEECAQAVFEPHPKPSDFDPRLEPLDCAITRAMSVSPHERQQEASDLARALRAFLRGVDVADVARALGDRVRDLRAESVSSPPVSLDGGSRASNASHGDLGTRTFAARDEAFTWSSSPIASDDASMPSTRRIEESETPSDKKLTRRDDPAMSIATPLMVDIDDLERIHADVVKSSASGSVSEKKRPKRASESPASPRDGAHKTVAPQADRLETIATRPLETPVRSTVRGSPSHERMKRERPFLLFGGIALAFVCVIALWRVRRQEHVDDAAGPAATVVSSPSRSASPAVSAALSEVRVVEDTSSPSAVVATPAFAKSASGASGGTPPTSTVVTTPPTSTGAVTPPASAASPAGRASVLFVGEPGTSVSIDGVVRGPCPVRAMLSEGPHEVRFLFEPTGESRGERFTVKDGEHVIVRAEFTGAMPTVKIQR